MRIAVIAGGLSHERDVSLKSGRRIVDSLRQHGHEVATWDFDQQFLRHLTELEADVAFVALHGGLGENGTVQAILEMAGQPYAGTRGHECRVAFDKAVAKTILRDASLQTPEWVTMPVTAFRDLGAAAVSRLVLDALGLPLMVKPVHGGSALGARAVFEEEELAASLVGAYSYGNDVLIERYVAGAEVAVPVLELGGEYVPLQPVLIEHVGPYDYRARYDASAGVRYSHLSDDDGRVDVPAVRALAWAVHEELGLRDVSRIDIRLDADGVPHVLEAAVTPGMTETSVWPMAVAAAGLDLGAVFTTMLGQRVADRSSGPVSPLG
ncbi:MAG: D-alanine--D-alanine ligase [Frankiales bacterium]|nr:D-alanine--D-alanine ligase [Frankiales bacterium]